MRNNRWNSGWARLTLLGVAGALISTAAWSAPAVTGPSAVSIHGESLDFGFTGLNGAPTLTTQSGAASASCGAASDQGGGAYQLSCLVGALYGFQKSGKTVAAKDGAKVTLSFSVPYAGKTGTLTKVLKKTLTASYSPPAITSISPANFPGCSGASVTISGSGFANSVSVAGLPDSSSCEVASSSSIVCSIGGSTLTAKGKATAIRGPKSLSVTVSNVGDGAVSGKAVASMVGQSAEVCTATPAARSITPPVNTPAAAPTITGVSMTEDSGCGGKSVTITGSGIDAGTTFVAGKGFPGGDCDAPSAGSIVCRTPSSVSLSLSKAKTYALQLQKTVSGKVVTGNLVTSGITISVSSADGCSQLASFLAPGGGGSGGNGSSCEYNTVNCCSDPLALNYLKLNVSDQPCIYFEQVQVEADESSDLPDLMQTQMATHTYVVLGRNPTSSTFDQRIPFWATGDYHTGFNRAESNGGNVAMELSCGSMPSGTMDVGWVSYSGRSPYVYGDSKVLADYHIGNSDSLIGEIGIIDSGHFLAGTPPSSGFCSYVLTTLAGSNYAAQCTLTVKSLDSSHSELTKNFSWDLSSFYLTCAEMLCGESMGTWNSGSWSCGCPEGYNNSPYLWRCDPI